MPPLAVFNSDNKSHSTNSATGGGSNDREFGFHWSVATMTAGATSSTPSQRTQSLSQSPPLSSCLLSGSGPLLCALAFTRICAVPPLFYPTGETQNRPKSNADEGSSFDENMWVSETVTECLSLYDALHLHFAPVTKGLLKRPPTYTYQSDGTVDGGASARPPLPEPQGYVPYSYPALRGALHRITALLTRDLASLLMPVDLHKSNTYDDNDISGHEPLIDTTCLLSCLPQCHPSLSNALHKNTLEHARGRSKRDAQSGDEDEENAVCVALRSSIALFHARPPFGAGMNANAKATTKTKLDSEAKGA